MRSLLTWASKAPGLYRQAGWATSCECRASLEWMGGCCAVGAGRSDAAGDQGQSWPDADHRRSPSAATEHLTGPARQMVSEFCFSRRRAAASWSTNNSLVRGETGAMTGSGADQTTATVASSSVTFWHAFTSRQMPSPWIGGAAEMPSRDARIHRDMFRRGGRTR
ncbi:hypothetical protein VTK73DRAFT_925 [Phialemonium thermophilum]|uniref:Uncharacterized protein n=1 Tax=Phialemonium thermophilum TaxID=223376 RepID=A0ABR3VU60_9PEZI